LELNSLLLVKIISILLSCAILVLLAIKKPGLSDFFEKAGLFGLFLFALFIPVKDEFAIFGMVGAIIFFIAYRIAKRDAKIPETGFNIPILIYSGIVTASLLWTHSVGGSINEGGEIVYFVMFFFAAVGLLSTKKRIDFMVNTFIFSISIAIIHGFFQGLFINAINSPSRLTGLTGNWTSFPVQVSYGLTAIIAYYLVNFTKQDDGRHEYLRKKAASFAMNAVFGIIVLAGFFDIVLSKARSAWIGIIPAIFVLMYLKSKRLFLIVLVLILVLNIGFFSVSKTFKGRIFSMFNPKVYKLELRHHGDIESHIALVESAWAVFKRFPLTGVGVGAFSKYFDGHKDVRFPWYYNPKTGKKIYDLYDNWPENGYMQTLAETGIFSFIALMWLFFLALKKPLKLFMNTDDRFKLKIAAMTLGADIVFYGSFVGVSNMSNDEITNLWFFFLAVFAAAVLLPPRQSKLKLKDL